MTANDNDMRDKQQAEKENKVLWTMVYNLSHPRDWPDIRDQIAAAVARLP